jgi:hypothetical protein
MENGNVNIATGLETLVYKTGTTDGQAELVTPNDKALASYRNILIEKNDIKHSYIRLGFYLNEFEKSGYFKEFGFDNMYSFASANLGLDKSAVSRCVSVFYAFSLTQDGVHKCFLDEKYKDYSYYQLCEMVSMKPQDRKKITPDMSIKQIREVKKKIKCCDVATDLLPPKYISGGDDEFIWDLLEKVVAFIYKNLKDVSPVNYQGTRRWFTDNEYQYEITYSKKKIKGMQKGKTKEAKEAENVS